MVEPAASGPATTFYKLPADKQIEGVDPHPSDAPKEVIPTGFFLMQAGASRRLTGQVAAVASVAEVFEYDAGIECIDFVTGNRAGPSSWASKNQTNTQGLNLTPSLLFTAPQAGLYVCRLLADGSRDQYAASANTWLRVDSADIGPANAAQWHNPACNIFGTDPSCTYLGKGESKTMPACDPAHWQVLPNAAHKYLLDDDCTPRSLWTAPSGIQSADVTANVGLTNCHGGTGSCVSTSQGGDHESSIVVSHLEAVQFDAAGKICNVTATASQVDTIDPATHHFNIPYHLANVPVLASCGSRKFLVRISMSTGTAAPVKIDGEQSDPNGDHTRDQHQTAAFIVGSTEPVTIPIVRHLSVPMVISFGEQAAKHVITAAGLPYTVTRTTSCTDPGDVWSQNPAGYMVVAEGTPVAIKICDAPNGGGGPPP